MNIKIVHLIYFALKKEVRIIFVNKFLSLFIIELCCLICKNKNKHEGHKIANIYDEESLKKENISLENSCKEFDEKKNKFEELKNKIENEMIKLDNLYEKIFDETTKEYELKCKELKEEESDLKDELKNKVTKIKENLEINLSEVNNILKKFEKISKYIKILKEGDGNIIKDLNYVSHINKKQKEMSPFLNRELKSLDISFNYDEIIYEEYYFNGIPIPKTIKFSEITGNSFKILWKIDAIKILNIDKEKIKYRLEIRKENENFISLYEGKDRNYIVKNLDYDTNYEVRMCSIYDNIKTDYTQIYNVKTDALSLILNKNNKRIEYINKLLDWTGFKSMRLIFRGTKDGMTSKDFHNKCDNKGKTISLFLNDKGNIFGGYSSIPWSNDGGRKYSKDCFLFTLTNNFDTEPTKFPYYDDGSVYFNSDFGPCFGYYDIKCGQNFNDEKTNSLEFPYSYKDVLGKGKSIFTGDNNKNNNNFILEELEVFELT